MSVPTAGYLPAESCAVPQSKVSTQGGSVVVVVWLRVWLGAIPLYPASIGNKENRLC